MKKMWQGLIFFLFFSSMGFGVNWCFDPKHFPINSVKFMGEIKHVSQEELKNAVISEIQKGFFRLKVSTLQRELLSLIWIKQVSIRKIWPDQVEICFEEHLPAAFWGEKGVLSMEGILFYPEVKRADPSLPKLRGPEGKSELVWQQFLVIKKTLSPLSLTLTELVLAPRGAWQLQLSNGITIVLGTDNVLERLYRFVHIYEKQLKEREKEIAYVDLRYTRGIAVGWRSG